MTDTPPPTDDERRRAACHAMTAAPGLIRYATRFTRSLHDAEDAYQRAMEIALTRAPVVEPQRFMAWLRTVLRNEALAVSSARRREGPAPGADVPDSYGEVLEDAVAVDVLAEWRERYRTIQDGLAGLTEAQRVCLMLQTAGASYDRIREVTGYSLRKVERSVLEGRKGLARWELRLAAGEECARLDEPLGRVAAGEATPKEQRAVSRHVKHCGACRATLRDRRESNEWLAALVPGALVGAQMLSGTPDPTPVFPWWERVADGATVRMGTLVHIAMELPGTAIAKVGAGTAAVVVAGAAALPLVVDTPNPETPGAAALAAEVPAPAATPSRSATEPPERVAPAHSQARRAAVARAKARATARAAETARARRAARSRAAAAARPTIRTVEAALRTSPSSTPAPAPAPAPAAAAPAPAPSAASVALEFGP